MTRLIKLTLKNFKSFKKAEVPISKGFSAIVGSNGSGKSNVLDALLFVLGITSLKALRAGKLTDLVNNDAKENYGKVDLTLKDDEKQYEISRMIDKQGKSVYRLDGKRTTLNEISSLLTELGIDVNGHNIVTQGDITKIIEMSPIERREVIDNIAGLSEFDQKKDEAIKELDKVDSKIKEATIIMNERNAFLSELEQEMKAAKEVKELDDERKRTKSTVIAKELYTIEKKILDADNEISELDKQKRIIEERVFGIRKELEESKKKSDDLSRQMIKASEVTYSTIGREYEEKKAKLLLEQGKIDMKNEQIAKNTEKIETNTSAVKHGEKERKELEEKQKRMEGELKEFERQIEEASKKKSQLEGIVKSKNAELAKEETKLEELNKQIEEARKEVFDLEVLARNWEKQKSFAERKLIEMQGEEKALEGEFNEIEKKKKHIEEHLKKEPHKNLADFEKHLSEIFEAKNLFLSKKLQEEKAINELKKAASQCPTCDSSLKEDKKALLLAQKEKLIREYSSMESEHAAKISDIKKRIDEEKERIMLIAKLSAETAHEKSLHSKLEELKKKIELTKKDVDNKEFDVQMSKRNKLNEKIKQLLEEKEKQKDSVTSTRKQDIFEEYSKANKTTEELIHKRRVVETAFNELKVRFDSLSIRHEDAEIENNALTAETQQLRKEIMEKEKLLMEIKEEVMAKEKQLHEAKKKNAILAEEKDYSDKKIDKFEKEIITESGKVRKIEVRTGEFNIEKSKLGVRQADLSEEKKEFEGIEPYASKSLDECKERLAFIEKRLNDIGAVNFKAVDNFNELKKEVDDIQQKATKLGEERMAVLDMIDKIEVKRTSVFMDCFNEINKNFKEIFFKFFNGEGDLRLADGEKPLDSGLMIDAKHKAGKLQNIDSMSGGEKTLTALAFMFAIQLYHPAPFYAFDEADAALDKENSLKMSNLIEKIAEKSQFIAITHNDVITKKAHQIIGVARGRDDSSVIGLKLKSDADEEIKHAKSNVTVEDLSDNEEEAS